MGQAVRTMLLPVAMCGVQDCHLAVLNGLLRIFRRFKMNGSLTGCVSKLRVMLPQFRNKPSTVRSYVTLFYRFL